MILRCAVWLYAGLLRLYPRSFRAEFEGEMSAVFEQALVEAAKCGCGSVVVTCLRELRDWPPGALREHWFSFKRWKEATMNKAIETNGPGTAQPRSQRRGLHGRSSLAVAGRLVGDSPEQNRCPLRHDSPGRIIQPSLYR